MVEACGNCGARLTNPPVPAPQGGFEQVCQYCGNRNHVPAAPTRRIVVMQPGPFAGQGPTRSGAGCATVFGLAVSLAIAGAVVFAVTRGSVSGGGSSVLGTEDESSWDEVGDPPIVTKVAGAEAIVGRLRNTGKDNQLYVGAFDGTTLKKRYKLGPFGTYTDGYQTTHVAVAGSHLVVSDFHSTAHVYNLDTGQQERVATLTDKVSSLCTVSANQVWIEQIDKRTVTMDLTSGAVTEAPRPATCPEGGSFAFEMPSTPKAQPKIQGFEGERQLDAQSMVVLLGKKTPGTATPMVVGLDKKTKAVVWQAPLPAVDLATVRNDAYGGVKNSAVFGDRVVAAYGVGQKAWHITALDAKTGTRQWDVTLKPIFAVDWLFGVTSSATRVYVVRMESVDVIDAVTGKMVGTIGHETYESDIPR